MAPRVVDQLWQPGHRAVVVLDFADHPGWIEPRQPRQIDGGLGMPRPLEHAPGAGPKGKHVTRTPEVCRAGGRMDGHLDRAGPVFGGDARTHAVLRSGVDADGERRLVAVGVAIHHQRQIEPIQPLPLHRQADQTPRLGGHEVDLLRGGELGGADHIAFVFPVFIVDDDDRFPVADCR